MAGVTLWLFVPVPQDDTHKRMHVSPICLEPQCLLQLHKPGHYHAQDCRKLGVVVPSIIDVQSFQAHDATILLAVRMIIAILQTHNPQIAELIIVMPQAKRLLQSWPLQTSSDTGCKKGL
jgi:hypothetical protein